MALLSIVVIGGLMLTAAPTEVQARSEYMKAFIAKYPDLKEKASKLKCGVCHAKSKKVRSDYGKELGKALGKPKVKDMDAIKKALTDIEKKGDVDGKTYGELLKAGMLPPKAEEK